MKRLTDRVTDAEIEAILDFVRTSHDVNREQESIVERMVITLRAYRSALSAEERHTLLGIQAVVNMNYPSNLKSAAIAVLDKLLALHGEPGGGDGE